jgi:hypothetical protein
MDPGDFNDENEFVAEWSRAHAHETARTIGRFSLIMAVASMIGIFFVAKDARSYLLIGHGAMAASLVIWQVAQLRKVAFSPWLLFVPQVILIATYAYVLHLAATDQGPNLVLAAACEMMIATMCMRLSPVIDSRILGVELVVFTTIAAIPLWDSPLFARWLFVLIFCLGFGHITEHLRFNRIRGEARLEFDARRRIRESERLAMERQLDLARQIQDSYAPLPTQLMSDQVVVNTYQQKHHALGGDWVGVRELAGGEVAIIVADAAGKGVQAALVTHALQSLWASASLEPGFDPVLFLERVNKTLLILGRASAQTMTIGLALISAAEVVYYSAGHVPCFVAVAGEAGRYVKALKARGNMVGVVDELDLVPVKLDLSKYAEVNVLLGSDGIFHSANQSRSPFILSTIDKLARDDAKAVLALDSGDDKLLIWVSRKAA